MKKLPTASSCLAPGMRPANYYNRDELIRSRDIDKRGDGPPDQTNALPTVLLLLEGYDEENKALVLDVASNTICYFDMMYEDGAPSYLDFPAEHAPTYLKRMLENYRTVTWVASYGLIFDTTERDCPWGLELRRTFLEDYHWPGDSFRQADWKRDNRGIVNRMMDEEI
ncbi:hypothetical protein LTR08_002933 [Meristemomyces frigidus]|nr:hypothetical protein LTR08_002933 [Meristemomyces frigidus]